MTLTEKWNMLVNEIKHEIESGHTEAWLNGAYKRPGRAMGEHLIYQAKVSAFRKVLAIMDQLTELQHLEKKGGKNDLQ